MLRFGTGAPATDLNLQSLINVCAEGKKASECPPPRKSGTINGFTLAEGATHAAQPKDIGRRKCAFTLAEVLITLGIIGVVAAITMPTLIQNYQKQTYVTGVKKAYSTIDNMLKKMQADEGVSSISETSISLMDYVH